MLLTVKDLSARLQIKTSTLYAWAAQGKIPCCRIHGLIRFEPEAIDRWLQSFINREPSSPPPSFKNADHQTPDALIARTLRDAYNPTRGNLTNREPSQKGGSRWGS